MTNRHTMRLMAMTLTLILGGGGVLQTAQSADTTAGPVGFVESDNDPGIHYLSADTAAGTVESPVNGFVEYHNDQGIRYLSGGVGEESRTELDALSEQFNLRLLFAMQGSGEYLASVQVSIRNTQGDTILATESKGPFLFTQLPPGDYTVEATASTPAQQQPPQQTVHIGDAQQSRLSFYWQ